MILTYTASSGNTYDLKSDKLKTKTADFHQWETVPLGISLRSGFKVTGFKDEPKIYETSIYIRGSYLERRQMVDKLHDDFERDLAHKTPGRITWGDWYIDCYIIASDTYPDEEGHTVNDIQIYCPVPRWISEINIPTAIPNSVQNVNWNQLFEPKAIIAYGDMTTIEFKDGLFVVDGRPDTDHTAQLNKNAIPVKESHRYLIRQGRTPSSAQLAFSFIKGSGVRQRFEVTGDAMIYEPPADGSIVCDLWLWQGAYYDFEMLAPQVFDLTEMFGAGLEPSIEQFRRWFPEEYYPYSELTPRDLTDGLNFPYDFPYDYSGESNGQRAYNIDAFDDLAFKLRFYGPDTDPHVTINGHLYKVFGSLSATDVLEIDSKDYTVTLLRGSQRINMFDNQYKESSVFEPINAESINMTWDDSSFDLTLYNTAREPKWRK